MVLAPKLRAGPDHAADEAVGIVSGVLELGLGEVDALHGRTVATHAPPVKIEGMSLPTQEQVTDKLRAVIDPELRKNIVELGMVRAIDIADDGRVGVIVSLTTPGCPIRSHFVDAVTQNVGELEGVTAVAVEFDVLSDDEKREPPAVAWAQQASGGRARRRSRT